MLIVIPILLGHKENVYTAPARTNIRLFVIKCSG